MHNFLTERYHDIILLSKKICKSNPEFEEVAHFAIDKFMMHERAQELVDTKKAMQFLSGIIHRSYWSSSSQYYTEAHQKGRVFGLPEGFDYGDYSEYNDDIDKALEAIEGILEDMVTEGNRQWYNSVMFQRWVETPNYSQIAKESNIPRTSIARAVKEAKEHIQLTLKTQGIEYEF
tara:strand:+ start:1148 stop:1675 length:528 start_codon:yes stop_codon:yes gene_type:complete